ncbi:MAG: 23S rRNA (adenine(2030)-N(6))-methyltransferase RlmJ, partial [Xanthobacteraceae bacterium]
VQKHAVLARILAYLQRKPAAFRVIDTHTGAGRYDLLGPEPSRGAEWHNGIERLWNMRGQGGAPASLLAPYLKAVEALNPDGKLRFYPGSPLIAASLLRPQDRLIACELEPDAAALLAAALRGNRRAKAVTIDGWTALGAYVPPKERRGLVVIDPPFEETGEFERLSSAFSDAYRKWPTGIYLMWYPIKERSGPDALARRLQRLGVPDILRCEMMLGAPRSDAGLVGSGLIVVNPPHTLQPDLQRLMPVIARRLSPTAASRIDWLAEETVPSR